MKKVLKTWNDVGNYVSKFNISANTLNNIIRTQNEHNVSFNDALSKGQLASKYWLLNEILPMFASDTTRFNIIICGGWFGTLSSILYSYINTNTRITSMDIDPLCEPVANSVNAENYANKQFNAITRDMYDTDYTDYNVVINTSCEHISDFDKWIEMIAPDTVLILQSNNYIGANGHVNCIESVEDFIRPDQVSTIYSKLTLQLPDYERYMIICMK